MMKLKTNLLTCIFFMFLFLVNFSSSSIEINQPFEVYNFGDSIFLDVTARPTVVSGNFEIDVVCNGDSVNLYKISPAESAFASGVSQKISHKIILTKEFIGSLSGNCHIKSSLGDESAFSNDFILTNDITIIAKTDKNSYDPSDRLKISIEARKANGLMLNGKYNFSGYANLFGDISNGVGNAEFVLDGNAPAGKYEILVSAYDEDKGKVLNYENINLYFNINQIPKKIDLSLADLEILPGNNFIFSVDLLDQSGKRINDTVDVKIIYSSDESKKTSLNPKESGDIFIEKNFLSGEYKIIASYKDIKTEKTFKVLEQKNIDIELLEGTGMFSVLNTGNIPFNEHVDVKIGNYTRKVLVDLKLNEEKRYQIRAIDGDYEVSIGFGNSSSKKILSLTGNAISINEWGGVGVFQEYPLVWIFIVLILFIGGLVIFLKSKNHKSHNFKKRSIARAIEQDKKESVENISKKIFQKKQIIDLSKPIISTAQSVPTLKGSRYTCSVVSIKLSNLDELTEITKNKINEIFTHAKDKFGVIDFKGKYSMIIYSPVISRTFHNEIYAVRTALKIKKDFDEYNKKIKDKIQYNIGINSGEMISAMGDQKLLYTSLDNGSVLAKRISDLSNSQVLISKTIKQKLMREIKTNQTEFNIVGNEIFELASIRDSDSDREKLKDILKRSSLD